MAKVIITYQEEHLTPEEINSQAKQFYGDNCLVEVQPTSLEPEHLILYAIDQLITDEQVNLMFNDKILYHDKMKEFRKKWNNYLQFKLNAVIMDNEERFG